MMHHPIHDEYPVQALRHGPGHLPRGATAPASAGTVDAHPSVQRACPIEIGSMHHSYEVFSAPISAARVTIAKARRLPACLNQNIRTAQERAGLESTRPQYDYMLYLDGANVGTIQIIELEPDLAFVGWVHVERHATGMGLGLALHRRVLSDYPAFAVEDFCSDAEIRTLTSLHRSGHRITERNGQADLGISRYCKVVDRMFVVERAS